MAYNRPIVQLHRRQYKTHWNTQMLHSYRGVDAFSFWWGHCCWRCPLHLSCCHHLNQHFRTKMYAIRFAFWFPCPCGWLIQFGARTQLYPPVPRRELAKVREGVDFRKLFPGSDGTIALDRRNTATRRTDYCVLDNVLSTYEYRQIVAQSRCVTIEEDASSIAAACMRTRSIVIGSISTSTARDPCEIGVFAGSA